MLLILRRDKVNRWQPVTWVLLNRHRSSFSQYGAQYNVWTGFVKRARRGWYK